MAVQQWSILTLTILPFACQSQSWFLAEDFTCKIFTKTDQPKSEAIYAFSLKKLKPDYELEKKDGD